MALNPRSVKTVEALFKEIFPKQPIEYSGKNQYGADEVIVFPESSLQTPELGRIYETSKAIGNTVSILIVKDKLCVCYW